MRALKSIVLSLIFVSAALTLWFVDALKPTSTGSFVFFSVWLVLPHAVLAATLVRRHTSIQRMGIALLVCAGGTVFLADAIFWHADAQGAIAVVFTPLLQGLAMAVLLALVSWRSRT